MNPEFQKDIAFMKAATAGFVFMFVVTGLVWTVLEFGLGIEQAIFPAYIIGIIFGIVVYIRIYLEQTNDKND